MKMPKTRSATTLSILAMAGWLLISTGQAAAQSAGFPPEADTGIPDPTTTRNDTIILPYVDSNGNRNYWASGWWWTWWGGNPPRIWEKEKFTRPTSGSYEAIIYTFVGHKTGNCEGKKWAITASAAVEPRSHRPVDLADQVFVDAQGKTAMLAATFALSNFLDLGNRHYSEANTKKLCEGPPSCVPDFKSAVQGGTKTPKWTKNDMFGGHHQVYYIRTVEGPCVDGNTYPQTPEGGSGDGGGPNSGHDDTPTTDPDDPGGPNTGGGGGGPTTGSGPTGPTTGNGD